MTLLAVTSSKLWGRPQITSRRRCAVGVNSDCAASMTASDVTSWPCASPLVRYRSIFDMVSARWNHSMSSGFVTDTDAPLLVVLVALLDDDIFVWLSGSSNRPPGLLLRRGPNTRTRFTFAFFLLLAALTTGVDATAVSGALQLSFNTQLSRPMARVAGVMTSAMASDTSMSVWK